jgi:outer membrane biosynthesis protein TonB
MSKDARFWRNVTLIALAHIALLVGLIHWSLQAKSSSNAQSIVWIGGAEGGAAETKSAAPAPVKILSAPAEPKLLKSDEPEDEKPLLTAAKSEIQLPTPKPTATSMPIRKPIASPTPKAKATPKPTPKQTSKPTPKPTPKKTVLAKASPKSSPKVKPTPAESGGKEPAYANVEKKKIEKTALAKKGPASNTVSQETSTGAGGRARSGDGTSEFGWYGNMLHDRFYSAWIQPTTSVTSGTKISTLVKVRIEKDGRVSNFEIIKPSENIVVNESVAAIAKRVTQVDPLPAGIGNGDHYDVKINFELSPEQAVAK